MKIVNRATFLLMPSNTLFSKYTPWCFEETCIKGETVGNDFFYQDITGAVKCSDSGEFADILEDAVANGSTFDLDFNCEGRDGLFDKDQLFAVWDKKDIEKLQQRITDCLY